MKKLLIIIAISLSLPAVAQEKGMVLIEGYESEPFKVIAHVQSMQGDFVTLQPNNPQVSYSATDTTGLEAEKEYVFWVRLTGCEDCRTKQVEILEADLTVFQIQKDQKTAADRIKQLTQKQK